MRDYSKFGPTFWTHGPGKKLRGERDAVAVAGYIFTCPTANMIGLYYLPIPTIAHELGMTFEEAQKGLQRVCEIGFAKYDETSENIFVLNAAREQIAKRLAPKDNRVKGVLREAFNHRKSPFFQDFLARYWDAFSFGSHLDPSLLHGTSAGVAEGAWEGLLSQDQDQEQEQEQEHDGESGPLDLPSPPKPVELEPGEPERKYRDTTTLVRVMWEQRHGPMAWTPKNVGHVKALASWLDKKDGDDEKLFARALAGFFADQWAIDHGFPLGALANSPDRYLHPVSGSRGFVEPSRAKAFKQTDLARAFGPVVKKVGGM